MKKLLILMILFSSCSTQDKFIPGPQWIKIEQSKREFKGYDAMAKQAKKQKKWRAKMAKKQGKS